jgi:hypothetical protein
MGWKRHGGGGGNKNCMMEENYTVNSIGVYTLSMIFSG